MTRAWLLPEFIEDILPPEAARIERLRRELLDFFALHGYELVMPPLLEYIDSLLTGTGHDLDLQTFKLVDQLSGRTLGVRADITPQVARIDAHLLNRSGVTRLCYAGSVLHTLPNGTTRTREPLQVGAELYGHAGIESDVEIQRLLMGALERAGVRHAYLDIGHVGIFRSLVRNARIEHELESELFRAMQAKDLPEVRELTKRVPKRIREAFVALPELYGGPEVLSEAARRLPRLDDIASALRGLEALSHELRDVARIRCFDLAELRGYHYHSGVVFAAYAEGQPYAIGRGGRYDEVGKAFGRARPATGFSADLRELAALQPAAPAHRGVLAPYAPADTTLQRKITTLRRTGTRVIVELPGSDHDAADAGYDRRLARRAGKWVIEKLEPSARERRPGKTVR
jgi:ATP phosphoribosyltransferase regulatory subunit